MRGFTLIEVLVVLTVVIILLALTLFYSTSQLGRARDAKRKSDLNIIKVAYEHYYNDHGCYPDPSVLLDCGSDNLEPYIGAIPCDPASKQPYLYLPDQTSTCNGYRVLSVLEDRHDPVIETLGCDSVCGCGVGPDYLYGVSAGMPVSSSECQVILPSPSPNGSPSSSSGVPGGGGSSPLPVPSGGGIGVYACDSKGNTCQIYDQNYPNLVYCPATFTSEPLCTSTCRSDPKRYACDFPD